MYPRAAEVWYGMVLKAAVEGPSLGESCSHSSAPSETHSAITPHDKTNKICNDWSVANFMVLVGEKE